MPHKQRDTQSVDAPVHRKGLALKLLAGLTLHSVLSLVFVLHKSVKEAARDQCRGLLINRTGTNSYASNTALENSWPPGLALGPELQQLALSLFPCEAPAPSLAHNAWGILRVLLACCRIIIQGPFRHHDWTFCCLSLLAPGCAVLGFLLAAGCWTHQKWVGVTEQQQDQSNSLVGHLQLLAFSFEKFHVFLAYAFSFINSCCSVLGAGSSPGLQIHLQNNKPFLHNFSWPLAMLYFKVGIFYCLYNTCPFRCVLCELAHL